MDNDMLPIESMNLLTSTLLSKYENIIGKQDIESPPIENIIEQIVNYYEEIIGCMPGNVYWLDKNGITVGCNKNVLAMFGFKSISEFKGLSFEEMGKIGNWSDEATQSFKKDTFDVINAGKAKLNIEEPPIPHHDGKIIYFLTSRVPLFDHTGTTVGIVGISIDITERKQQEEELRQAKQRAEIANRAKGEFLENMRHDIRTPLAGITGFAKILREEATDPKIQEYAENIVASSDALAEFLNEILEAIRVASGEVPLLKTKFDLKKRLADIVHLNQAKAKQKNLDLQLDYDPAIPAYLIGDSKRIQRIVLELVTNALNFTDKGSVKISTQLAKKDKRDIVVKISVTDTGIGISPTEQQEIFVRFKRLNPSYEGIYKGAGLGLAVIKQFIDDLEGEIYVESQPGKGASFTCIIPLKEALLEEGFGIEEIVPIKSNSLLPDNLDSGQSMSGMTTSRNQSTSTSSTNLNRILVIEDQTMAAKVAEHVLSGLGCQVDHAPNGETALKLFKQHRYDMIFMDVGLPDMSGFEVTKRIRLQEWNAETTIPIIALTAHVDGEDKQRCIEAGMNAVLTKPMVKETAADILNAFIPHRTHTTKTSTTKKSTIAATTQHSDLLTLNGPVIDYQGSLQLTNGNPTFLKEMFDMLVASFPEELQQLNQAHAKKDWKKISDIAHKLKGGASYCSAPRLKEACGRLESYLRKDARDLAEPLYQQMLQEMETLRKYELESNG
jgi:two-component system aerobic respiration control sensor histidine kinase ArcB